MTGTVESQDERRVKAQDAVETHLRARNKLGRS